MAQVWREDPAADPFDRTTVEGRLAFHQWFADNAAALGADAKGRRRGGRTRQTRRWWRTQARAADIWRDAPWRGEAAGALDWLREPTPDAVPRACQALLAARGDLRQRFADDPDGLLAWCLGPEAAAGRFAPDLLPIDLLQALAQQPAALFEAARLAERALQPTDLRRRLNAPFGAGERAGWPRALTEPLRAPFLAPAKGRPAPFVRLFLEIWEERADLQRLYPLAGAVEAPCATCAGCSPAASRNMAWRSPRSPPACAAIR